MILGMSQPVAHRYPDSLPRSSSYRAKVNGVILDVLHHAGADHASFECSGAIEIELELSQPAGSILVRPLRLGINPAISGQTARFVLPGPQMTQIEVPGQPLLYLYALPVAQEDGPTGPNVRRFEAGKIHEAGVIRLRDGETCWLEAGAVVRGSIVASGATKVRIGGYGILDGSYGPEKYNGQRFKAIVLDRCTDTRIENLLMLGPTSWMISIGASERIEVQGVRQIAVESGTDGIDIVGSRSVRISSCCLHNGDDNIAIKSFARKSSPELSALGFPDQPWDGTVEDVLVTGCLFYGIKGGSSMEIGFETATAHIRRIRFEDCDVLALHEFGSVFGIHTGDRATVEDIIYEDIRVEHHYDKLVDFRVLRSRWNTDSERGRVRNVTLRHIRALQSIYNPGYTLSVITGFDADHAISGVHFDDFELGGNRVLNADQLDLVTRHAHEIHFQ